MKSWSKKLSGVVDEIFQNILGIFVWFVLKFAGFVVIKVVIITDFGQRQ